MSRYLSDLRLIHNIFNEYAIYVANLETDGENVLDATKLLAVLIYKNVYPRDFEQLHRGEGHLAGILGRKDEIIATLERGYRSEIANLERDIAAAEQQIPKDRRELNRIYAMALLETLPANTSGVGRTPQESIAPNSLSEHADFEQIITTPNLHCRQINNYRSQHNNSSLEEKVDPNESYAERVRSIEQKADAQKKAAHRRISVLKSEIKTIRTSKFNALLRSSTLEIENLFENIGEGGELARFLLLEGHLDDSVPHLTKDSHL